MTIDDIDQAFARALELYAAGDRVAALAAAEEILDAVPDHPDALHLSGVMAMEEGDLARAKARLSAALAAAPDTPDFLNSLANLARAEGDTARAIDCYRRAIAADPSYRDAHYNLALMLEKTGDNAGAEIHFGTAVAVDPGFALGHYARGRVALDAERFAEAAEHFTAALRLDEAFADAHAGLGAALKKLRRIVEAIPHFRRAAEIDPANANALSELAQVYHVTGRTDQAMAMFRRCLEIDPDNQPVWDSYLFTMTFDGSADLETHVRENRRWGAQIAARLGRVERTFPNPRDPGRRLRIGYVAGELFDHVTSYNLLPVLERHDRAAFEIACYSTGGTTDALTVKIRDAADLWRDLAGQSPGEIAASILADRVDILVGISPFRASNRVVLAYRPAPVIVSYMNQVGTTGLDAVDYLVADSGLYPEGMADARFPEQIVRLSNFNVYLPPDAPPAVEPPPCIGGGGVTFACLSGTAKIGAAVIDVWSQILRAVPGARLLLMSPNLDDATLRDRMFEQFAAHDLAADRIDLSGSRADRRDYLRTYNRIDIALDPFPFGGGAVTYDALSMSTPIVALQGDYGYRRMTSDLLTKCGLGELIATDVEDYIGRAIDLAGDPERIAAYKRGIRARARSAIFDADLHIRELEAAYGNMWRIYCGGD